MLAAIWVLTAFATLWGLFGDHFSGLPPVAMIAPPLISVALLAWALPGARAAGARGVLPNARRVVRLWSLVEVALIALAVIVLPKLGHSDKVVPAIVMIVGAHLLPIAHGLNVRSYWLTGSTLIAVGLAALEFSAPAQFIWSGWMAALILWATVAWLGVRGRQLAATA